MKQVEVVAAVIVRSGLVFCAQRRDEGETARKWEFPGGKIEPGETREQALEREILEELGIRISVGAFIATVRHRYRTFFLVMHVFFASIAENREPVLSAHDNSRWLSPSDLSGLNWAAADIPAVNLVQKKMCRELQNGV